MHAADRSAPACASLESVFDIVDGRRIHGRVAPGAGNTTLVFVHGLGVSTRYMEPTMARLCGRFPVAALDLPGFGRSEAPGHLETLAEHADTLERWLRARDVARAILVGNSYGCQVIVEHAVRHPGRAVGLVLNAPTIDPAHRNALTMLARVLADVPRESARLAAIVTRDYLRAGPRRLIGTLRAALADRIEEKLPRIALPTLVVVGARDPVVTVAWADEVARLVGLERPGAAGAALQTVASAAHALPFDDPDVFAGILANFAEHGVPAPAAAR